MHSSVTLNVTNSNIALSLMREIHSRWLLTMISLDTGHFFSEFGMIRYSLMVTSTSWRSLCSNCCCNLLQTFPKAKYFIRLDYKLANSIPSEIDLQNLSRAFSSVKSTSTKGRVAPCLTLATLCTPSSGQTALSDSFRYSVVMVMSLYRSTGAWLLLGVSIISWCLSTLILTDRARKLS